jgi:hypothetical protein
VLSKRVQSASEELIPFQATISTSQQEINLASWATGQGWDGVVPAEITIDSGVYIWSDDAATPALTTGNFPRGLKLYVNGYIIGKGGRGGQAATADPSSGGGLPGGPALLLECDVTIIGGVDGYIAGGGGGGAYGGYITSGYQRNAGGGGGAGGGAGGGTNGNANTNYSSTAGGTIGQTGSNGSRTSGGAVADGSGAGGGGG